MEGGGVYNDVDLQKFAKKTYSETVAICDPDLTLLFPTNMTLGGVFPETQISLETWPSWGYYTVLYGSA